MNHPIFHDVPSKDMSKALARQATLDAQVQAFLDKGGEIKAFDPMRRPIERDQWKNFSIHPAAAGPRPVTANKKPTPAAKNLAPAPAPVPVALAVAAQPVAKVRKERVVGRVAIPKAATVDDEIHQLLKEAAAIKRSLESLEHKVAS